MEPCTDEGLNFLRQLNVGTPVSGQMRAHRLRLSYNGNYEGDTSMFRSANAMLDDKEKAHYNHELDGEESDVDLETEKMIADSDDVEYTGEEPIKIDTPPPSPPTAYHKAMQQLMANEQIQQAIAFTAILTNHKYCKHFIGSLQIVYCTMLWAVMFLMRALKRHLKLNVMTLPYCINSMRTMARHVLWWMTLSNSGDCLHFGRMVVGAPIVFMIATIGLMMSLYAAIRVHTNSCYRFVQTTNVWMRHA